ncbi:hypothetical protein A2V54_01240 [candidate division WWE3 bacterium RBG_19FT_COMBO_53_11]|uniref:Uncharacterized protein n=1 Tax=candidate division WWE3 bacterium RBG_19FT_COMBO_53_11 TaxID=1802613 RepID=A0A1F4UIW2_UNCKA|nr:MAG: hypothetical protein A2V54_01240 [candidate division WWE3 bacterium RBG_19FT_COMBO_53_11]
MSDQAFFVAILAIIVLMVVILAVLLLLTKKRKPAVRSAASLAETFADQILAGNVSEGLLKHYSSTRGKCKNCGGRTVRWTPASAEEHLQRPRLVAAIQNQELCEECIFVLAKTVAGWKVVPVPVGKPSPAPAPAPAPQKEKGPGVGKRIAVAVGEAIAQIPSLLWKVVKWVFSKLFVIWGILFLLGIDVFAIRMMFWVAGAADKYQQGIFITFMEYGVAGLAVVIMILTLIPLLPLLRRLVK